MKLCQGLNGGINMIGKKINLLINLAIILTVLFAWNFNISVKSQEKTLVKSENFAGAITKSLENCENVKLNLNIESGRYSGVYNSINDELTRFSRQLEDFKTLLVGENLNIGDLNISINLWSKEKTQFDILNSRHIVFLNELSSKACNIEGGVFLEELAKARGARKEIQDKSIILKNIHKTNIRTSIIKTRDQLRLS